MTKALVQATTSGVALSTAAGVIDIDGSIASSFRVNGAVGNQTLRVSNIRPGQTVWLFWSQDGVGGRTLTIDAGTVQQLQFAGAVADLTPSAVAFEWSFYAFTLGVVGQRVAVLRQVA